MHAPRCFDRSAATQSPSLRTFLADLPEEDILRISEPTDLDYLPTALVLELEKRRRTPVVMIERPKGFDCPVVTNLFASRDRIARMVGAEPGGFNDAWVHALAHLTPPTVVSTRPGARSGHEGQRARRRRAADQPPLRKGRRPLHRLRHPGLQGSRTLACATSAISACSSKGPTASAPACIRAATSGSTCSAARRAGKTSRSRS